jgi:hypothetical protein
VLIANESQVHGNDDLFLDIRPRVKELSMSGAGYTVVKTLGTKRQGGGRLPLGELIEYLRIYFGYPPDHPFGFSYPLTITACFTHGWNHSNWGGRPSHVSVPFLVGFFLASIYGSKKEKIGLFYPHLLV